MPDDSEKSISISFIDYESNKSEAFKRYGLKAIVLIDDGTTQFARHLYAWPPTQEDIDEVYALMEDLKTPFCPRGTKHD